MDPTGGAGTIERKLMQAAAADGRPVNGSLELLPLCNLSCDMCYVRLTKAEQEAKGPLLTAEQWLAIGRQMQASGTLFLLLTGGEPLLYPDFKQVYLGLKKLGFVLSINTNGTLIDEEWADFFAQNKPRRINITLYGPDNESYEELCHCPDGFDRVSRAIELLQERELDLRVGSSITPRNVDKAQALLALSQKLKCPFTMDSYMLPAQRERGRAYDQAARLPPEDAARVAMDKRRFELDDESYARFIAEDLWTVDHVLPRTEAEGMSCLAGSCSFTINWQGEMRPCVVFASPSEPVLTLGVEEAWRRIHSHCAGIRLNPQCARCQLRPICRTCAACALLESGSYEALPDYMCRYTHECYRLLRAEKERLGLVIQEAGE